MSGGLALCLGRIVFNCAGLENQRLQDGHTGSNPVLGVNHKLYME